MPLAKRRFRKGAAPPLFCRAFTGTSPARRRVLPVPFAAGSAAVSPARPLVFAPSRARKFCACGMGGAGALLPLCLLTHPFPHTLRPLALRPLRGQPLSPLWARRRGSCGTVRRPRKQPCPRAAGGGGPRVIFRGGKRRPSLQPGGQSLIMEHGQPAAAPTNYRQEVLL